MKLAKKSFEKEMKNGGQVFTMLNSAMRQINRFLSPKD